MINLSFLDLFTGLATILTGVVAFIIYFRQKKDSKIQAARVLLTEIRTAEERIEEIRGKVDSGLTTDLPFVFPTKSWKNYSHLFISDFDQDELRLISSFYDYGELIEYFAKRNNDFFWVSTEERARITQHILAQVINEAYTVTSPSPEEYITKKRDFFSQAFDRLNILYTPQKNTMVIQEHLNKIQKITTSSCGLKLKKLAKLH